MKRFSFQTRSENLKKLSEEQFDLLIIGGGINGAGVARDASSRGMKVAVIEAKDFASGTSSRSSKLIHGGLRYLENMEFKLVFEALNERTRLFEMAPHLVHPLRFMVPLYSYDRVGMFKMGLGMWLYDALSLFQAPQMHERLDVDETMTRMPILHPADLLGSFVYSDAYMDDDRLVYETLRSANEMGAVCANFVKAEKAIYSADQSTILGVEAKDAETGQSFKIKCRHIVSTVGPWTDDLGSRLVKDWKKILRPTKGVHLTLRRTRLPLSSAVVMADNKRIVFAIPRHDMVIIGTTDTDFKEDPGSVVADREDVKYLLGVTERYFPGAHIKVEDIVAVYAGVRPLVFDGSESEGKTSREHTIVSDERGVTFVAGGKYTTYRLMAEEIVDRTLLSFELEDRVKFGQSNTEVPLNPMATVETFFKAKMLREKWARESGRAQAEVDLLIERHGLEAEEILFGVGFGAEEGRTGGRVQKRTLLQLEALHSIENTMCLHLVDFYTRRFPLFLSEPEHGVPFIDELVDIFREKLGWSAKTIEIEKQMLIEHEKVELACLK